MSMTPALKPARKHQRALTRLVAGLALSGGLVAGAAIPASAAPVLNSGAVLATASQYIGTPYRFGGTSPSGFDCSGYTQHVYADNGIALARTTSEQLATTTRISKSEARPGDLVFFVNAAGRPYHVGIYTGDGRMMDSPRTGKSVSERSIWTEDVIYTRV
ncbi:MULTISPECIES: C40 family peptidase [Actinomycetes]|uniref:DUF1175 family protein n=1 Tax=Quadrisphaera setariae TaxID=2593304 RepID=A0A5C8Z660_9ACTN|nr:MULTISPECIES: C40 family peptidase [Actinomycetes]TNM60437.1 NlpC/P60 family protein [Streptomyces sp. NP160]TXR52420.1 DUF1175 family protein [Quadrisphaera setariae]